MMNRKRVDMRLGGTVGGWFSPAGHLIVPGRDDQSCGGRWDLPACDREISVVTARREEG